MPTRVLLAGVLGAVAMFIWSSIAHMALPLGEAGLKQIENEQTLLTTMQSTIPAQGLYFFPKMTDPADQTKYQQQIATGPSGIIAYFPRRDFNFGKSLAIEFVEQAAQALIAAYLLSLTVLTTFGRRVLFYALAGLLAVSATNISYWNWYGFTGTYTAAYMFTDWFGYVCAGLVAAAMKIGGHPSVTAPAGS